MTSTVMPAILPSSIGPAAIAVSPTLAANEVMAARQRRGEPVLPLAFGEAGLPAHPSLRRALAEATGQTGYGTGAPARPRCARRRPATGTGAGCAPTRTRSSAALAARPCCSG